MTNKVNSKNTLICSSETLDKEAVNKGQREHVSIFPEGDKSRQQF